MYFLLKNLHILRGVLESNYYKKFMENNDFILDCLNTDLDVIDWRICNVDNWAIKTAKQRRRVVAVIAAQVLNLASKHRILGKQIKNLKAEIRFRQLDIDLRSKDIDNGNISKGIAELGIESAKVTVSVWKENIRSYEIERAANSSLIFNGYVSLMGIIEVHKKSLIEEKEQCVSA